MLNKAPIFVNGFHRGGTNIIMNLMVSHPGVCMPAGETQEVFHGMRAEPIGRLVRRALYLPIWAAARQHTFHPKLLSDRNALPGFMMRYIDLLLYVNRFTVFENRFKAEGVRYSRSELGNARIVSKNGSGTVLATDIFARMYPDATFIALVRNGLAVCEGMMRREMFTAEGAGAVYETVCQRMIRDAYRMGNYHIVRFEDMISDPLSFMEELYGYAGLDVASVPKFRFEARPSTSSDGRQEFTLGNEFRKLYWFPLEEIGAHLRADVNENQIAQLSEADRESFLRQARRSMEHFGYLEPEYAQSSDGRGERREINRRE